MVLAREEVVDRIKDEARGRHRTGSAKGGKRSKPSKAGDERPAPSAKKRGSGPRARDRLAKAGGLRSGRQLDKDACCMRRATAREKEDLRSGRVSINEVHNRVRRDESAAQAAERAATCRAQDLGGEVIWADAFLVSEARHGTADLVILDPPYGISGPDKFAMRGQRPSSLDSALPTWDRVNGMDVAGRCLEVIAKLLRPTGSYFALAAR